jgi:hypothetical protein
MTSKKKVCRNSADVSWAKMDLGRTMMRSRELFNFKGKGVCRSE